MNFSQFQRLRVFCLSFLLLLSIYGYAQSEKFATELDRIVAKLDISTDQEAVGKLEKHPNAKDVHYFKMGNLANVQKNGLFDFPSPVTGKIIHAMTTHIEYKSDKDYIWYGTVSDNSLQGDMMLISENGKIYGHLNFKDESYQIYGVGNGLSAFVPSVKVPAGSKECSDNIPKGKHFDNPDVNTRTTTTCPYPTSVLVLYTSAAQAYDANIVQTATSAYNLFRQAVMSSNASVPFLSLAGVQQISSFNETGNIYTDIKTLEQSSDAQSQRYSANADIVVLLTNGNYAYLSGAYGIADMIGTDFAHAYCIVEDANAVSGYTFAHEIGHLYGGCHQGADGESGISYAHGYLFQSSSAYYSTLMFTHEVNSYYTRILQYSNPNVSYNGTVTGNTGISNVTRRMNELASGIAAFYDGGTGPLSVSIEGPSLVTSSGCYTYYYNLNCGANLTSTNWSVSSDGYNYTNISGANSSAQVCVYPYSTYASSGKFYLKLDVTSFDGQSATAFYYVGVSGVPHYLKSNNSSTTIGVGKVNIAYVSEAYPNPTNTEANINFSIPKKQAIKLELFNEIGASVRLLELGEYETGEYQSKVDAAVLAPGLYFYKFSAGEFNQTKKLLVTK